MSFELGGGGCAIHSSERNGFLMLTLSNLRYDDSGFCWMLESDRFNVVQARYHVQVADGSDFSGIIWDSGEVESDRSVFVPYAGPDLPACESLYWRVRVIDNYGDDSGWSGHRRIMTGPGRGEWMAKFITPETDEDALLSKGKLLRTEFALHGELERAIVYVTALGLYELYINGDRVGDALFAPGWTEYSKRVLYQTWDVTPLLRQGENALGAVLGAGWFKGDLGWLTLGGLRNIYGDRTALLVQMDVRFCDGRRLVICSDDVWKCSDGSVSYSLNRTLNRHYVIPWSYSFGKTYIRHLSLAALLLTLRRLQRKILCGRIPYTLGSESCCRMSAKTFLVVGGILHCIQGRCTWCFDDNTL